MAFLPSHNCVVMVYDNFYDYTLEMVHSSQKKKKGIDYFDTYALINKISTIWTLLVLASIQKLTIHQKYVKIGFLNGELVEEIYMDQPDEFIVKGQENKVCKLAKSLYGFKQASK